MKVQKSNYSKTLDDFKLFAEIPFLTHTHTLQCMISIVLKDPGSKLLNVCFKPSEHKSRIADISNMDQQLVLHLSYTGSGTIFINSRLTLSRCHFMCDRQSSLVCTWSCIELSVTILYSFQITIHCWTTRSVDRNIELHPSFKGTQLIGNTLLVVCVIAR